ncbi:MAG: hypothetical protein OJF50_004086 [Nitrospira sp.]|nr:hypothetical protein [Nitrospira sp.]
MLQAASETPLPCLENNVEAERANPSSPKETAELGHSNSRDAATGFSELLSRSSNSA